MALTGLPDQPLGPPEGLVEGVAQLGRQFPGLDTLALVGERAALMGLWRRGATSCGGSCRLYRCADDGFMAVSLPRDEDMEMVPAWLELDTTPASAPAMWSTVAASVRHRNSDVLRGRAQLLGLPVALVGEATRSGGPPPRPGVLATRLGDAPARPDVDGTLVIDLSALWAGPLCGDLLAGSGATVIKVESTQRPDGARRGAGAFYDLLNGRKRSVALDLQTPQGVRILHALVRRADVVIEASRPRALAQFGLDAHDAVGAPDGPQVWVSITGYGRSGEEANRVAFGDDAAAAGGLVTQTADGPLFCADAVADPLTGLTAAAACLDKFHAGGRWLLDISMAAVSAGLAGPTLPVPADGLTVADPHARQATKQASDLGADTAHVLADLGIDG
jgi:CoA-transferase family III